jgi:hypothetical protein
MLAEAVAIGLARFFDLEVVLLGQLRVAEDDFKRSADHFAVFFERRLVTRN